METVLIHTFTRQEVEALDFQRFDSLFDHWPQLWSRALREKFNSLVFMVNGYDDDERELYCVPEVRRFYQELHKRWPWWAFFLANIEGNIAIPYLCLLDSVEAAKRDGDATCAASIDIAEIEQLLLHDFSRFGFLADIAGLTSEQCENRFQSIMQLFTGGQCHE